MNRSTYFTKSFLIFIIIWPITVLSSIIDSDVAQLSPAQKAWLLNRRDAALKLYTVAVDSSNTKEIESYNVAYLYFLKADFDKAGEYVLLALKQNPEYGPALLLKGLLAYRQGNQREARQYLELAVKYHAMPEIPAFYFGKCLFENGEFKEALELFKKAVNKNKLFTYPYAYIGRIYRIRGEYESALKYLEKGLIYSYDADILLGLIDICTQLERVQERDEYSRIFAYLFPQHPDAEEIIADLNRKGIDYSSAGLFSQPPPVDASDRFFEVGEDLLYSVYWGPLRIGELHAVVEDRLSFNGVDAYRTLFSLDSNPTLGFVASLHSDYTSIIGCETKQVLQHFIHARENDIIHEKVYDFDREAGMFYCRVIREDGHIEAFEKPLPKYGVDGTSILFYARQMVKKQLSENLLTVIDEGFAVSEIIVNPGKEPIICAGKEENTVLVTGRNHYKGIVGFTGGFRGWFREGPSYLPLEADFEIWVGRIRITLATPEETELHRYSQ